MNKNKRQASVQRTVTMGNAVRQDGKERQVEIIDDEDDEIEEISKVFFFSKLSLHWEMRVFSHMTSPSIWIMGEGYDQAGNLILVNPQTSVDTHLLPTVRGSFYKLNTPFFVPQFMAGVRSTRAMK